MTYPRGTPFKRFLLHVPILLASFGLAIWLGMSGLIHELLAASNGSAHYLVAAFIAGVFYSSFVTVAPSVVALFEIGQAAPSPVLMAVFGGLGAMIADLSIFQVMKFSVIDDIVLYFQRKSGGHFRPLARSKVFKVFSLLLGAFIIASPFPDEIGLAFMGIAKARWYFVLTIGFLLNALGILALVLIAQAT